jgi:hypothetical protein
MADNQTVQHDAMQLMAAGVAMAQHIERAHFTAISLKNAINDAETVEAIQGIDIEAAPWVA